MILHLVNYLVYKLMGLAQGSRIGDAVHFFIYDSLKIVVLLAFMILLISFIRSYIPPEKARRVLSAGPALFRHTLAALVGVVTPFCSCSSVPIFIGFVESGVTLGVTFSFLIASPLVNEVSLAMLVSLFGWKVATLYVAAGVFLAVVGGMLISRLKLEHEVEEYVYALNGEQETAATAEVPVMSLAEHWQFAVDNARDIVQRVWLYVLIGVGVGALIHGYVPQEVLVNLAGSNRWWSVPMATLLGVPLYGNAVGTIPIVQALIGKGVSMGTALSFMMAVTALSLPEMIILRKVIKPKLISIFVGIVAVGITLVGYLFNVVLG